jgi:predicted dehydrogenase
MADLLRIGVIGAGWNTKRRHIPGFQAIDGVQVVAVCNRSLESGQAVADEFGIPRVETDPAALFGDPDIDAICIGTWPYKHREYVLGALEGGKHVLTEARLAMNATEAREMLDASQRHPDLVAQVVPTPYDMKTRLTVRRVVREGVLGDILEVHTTVLSGNGLDPDTPLHWREQQALSGMNIMSLGIWSESLHDWISPLSWVMADGSIHMSERTDAATGERKPVDLPDSLFVIGGMENGARNTIRISSVTHGPAHPNGVSIHGTKGTLHWEQGERMTLALRGEDPRPLDPDPGTDEGWRVEQDFVDSIRTGKPVDHTSFEDGVLYMRATEAVWRSMQEQRRVELSEV